MRDTGDNGGQGGWTQHECIIYIFWPLSTGHAKGLGASSSSVVDRASSIWQTRVVKVTTLLCTAEAKFLS